MKARNLLPGHVDFSLDALQHRIMTDNDDDGDDSHGEEIKLICQKNEVCVPACRFLITISFLISSFRRVLYVVCFLLGNYPASGFYMPTFRNTLSVPSS